MLKGCQCLSKSQPDNIGNSTNIVLYINSYNKVEG